MYICKVNQTNPPSLLSSLLLSKQPRGGGVMFSLSHPQVQFLKAHAELRGSHCHIKTSLRSAATPEK